jgi:signal peptidase I
MSEIEAADEAPAAPAADETASAPANDRWESALWSLMVPGLGQIRAGDRASGFAILGATIACALVAFLSFVVPSVPTAIGAVALPAMLGIALISIVHAFRAGRARDHGAQPPSAWKSAFLSRLFPGLGQLVERRILAGILLIVALLAASAIEHEVFGEVAYSGVVAIALFDALFRSRRARPSQTRARSAIVVAVIIVLIQLLLPLTLRRFVVQAFRLPSESMLPTLHTGDYLFVDRSRAGRAAQGELIAHRFPQDRTKQFVKRCVAVEGQTVEIRDKQLFVDGRAVDEPFVIHTDPETRSASDDPRDNFGPFIVPKGQVFVMGDNRENSNDSRYWGPVPLEDVLGRTLKIYWPPSRWSAVLR